MKPRILRSKFVLVCALALCLTSVLSAFRYQAPGDTYLSEDNFMIKSLLGINMSKHFATFRLHQGSFNGMNVWYIITDASDFGLAHDLNVNYAPKLANMAIGCPACVQEVMLQLRGQSEPYGVCGRMDGKSSPITVRQRMSRRARWHVPAVAKRWQVED